MMNVRLSYAAWRAPSENRNRLADSGFGSDCFGQRPAPFRSAMLCLEVDIIGCSMQGAAKITFDPKPLSQDGFRLFHSGARQPRTKNNHHFTGQPICRMEKEIGHDGGDWG